MHALQREPKDVFASLKCFEQIGVDLRSLLRAHPQSLVYSKAHIEKVRIFIAREVSDLRGVDVRVLQRCPQILAVNLAKAKATLRWLRSADLLSVSQILEQCPALLARVDAQRMAQTLQCLMGAHIGKGPKARISPRWSSSSDAARTILLAMYNGSQPPSSIRISQ